jgi:indolepyruvate decarboxylase
MEKYITGKKISDTVKTANNLAEYVVARLVDLGITHSFSVPGDFAFAIDHALINNPKLKNIVSANELNASYAADGYARVKGAAILSTTFAVGELCALNGVMGSKAENNIVFHLVGFPGDSTIAKRRQAHHTLGNGDFNQFQPLSASAACVSALITPDNARREMNRVICEAFKYRQPAYIMIGLDAEHHPVTDTTPDLYFAGIKSNPQQLAEAIILILDRLNAAKKVVVVPAIKLDRFHLTQQAIQFIEALDVPFVIMPHDKATISEHHPNYAGLYAGGLSDPKTENIVEGAELVLNLGDVLWSDFSTAGYSNHLDMKKVINLGLSFVPRLYEKFPPPNPRGADRGAHSLSYAVV